MVGDAYTFLQQQGCINMGVPAGEPDLDKEPEEAPEAFPTDDDIIRALQDILKNADLQVGFRFFNLSANCIIAVAHWHQPLHPPASGIILASKKYHARML